MLKSVMFSYTSIATTSSNQSFIMYANFILLLSTLAFFTSISNGYIYQANPRPPLYRNISALQALSVNRINKTLVLSPVSNTKQWSVLCILLLTCGDIQTNPRLNPAKVSPVVTVNTMYHLRTGNSAVMVVIFGITSLVWMLGRGRLAVLKTPN